MGVFFLSSGSFLLSKSPLLALVSDTLRIKGIGCGCYGVILCLMGKSIYNLYIHRYRGLLPASEGLLAGGFWGI